MVRWRYLIPRFLLVGLVVWALVYGGSPLARWLIVTWGTKAIGAKVEVDGVEVALWRADVRLQNLRVTDPLAPLQNLFELAEAKLDLDRNALLERKLVVREGRLTGLRFDTARESSGAVPPAPAPPSDFQLPFDKAWLRAVAGRVQEDWESNLQTIRLGQELSRRWPEEYRKLETQAEDIKARVQKLRDLAREAQKANPLRGVEIFQTATEQATAVRQELETLPRQVQQLRDQALRDRDAMHAAKDHDLAYIKERLQLKAFDAQSLTRYLLDEEQSREVAEVLAWVQWARHFIPAKRETAAPQRQRGRTVVFPGLSRTPKVLFEELAVSGEALWRGQPLAFAGRITGLTTDPACYGRPATVTVQTSGEYPVLVTAVVDRTVAAAHDHVSLQCPRLALPARNLGDRDALTVSLASAPADVRIELDVRGEVLAGQIRVTQPQVQVQTALSPACGGEQLAARLNQALGHIRSLEVAVDLSGTLDHPQWSLASNLGPQLAAGVQSAVRAELADRGQQATARLNEQLNHQLARLEQLVAAKSQKLFGDSEALKAEVEQLAKSFLGRVNLADRLPPPIPGLPKPLQNLPNSIRDFQTPIRAAHVPTAKQLLRQ